MPVDRRKTETVGFGFQPAGGDHHFVVSIPLGGDGTVTAEERFVYGESVEEAAARARFSAEDGRPPVRHPNPKVALSVTRWERVAEEVRAEFNRRLLRAGLGKSAWKAGENCLAPHLGRELVLLLWALEEPDPGAIPNVLANWQGLAPEERWWLYTTINAATGHASEGRGKGWRKAIGIAFADNPVTGSTSGAGYFAVRSSNGTANGKRATRKRAADTADPSPPLPFDEAG